MVKKMANDVLKKLAESFRANQRLQARNKNMICCDKEKRAHHAGKEEAFGIAAEAVENLLKESGQ